MAHVLVTGGGGFIGGHLVDRLLDAEHAVTVVDRTPLKTSTIAARAEEDPGSRFTYVQDELSIESAMRGSHRMDYDAIVHLAADVTSTEVMIDPEHAWPSQTSMVQGLAQVAEANQIPFVYASSAAVLGEVGSVQGAAENMMTRPFGLYGLTKKTGEQICASIGHGTVLRFANVYGPRQDASAESGAIARWTHAALTGQICHVFGDGRAVRDFVYVEDVAKVLEWAAVGGPLAAPPMSPCLFHVGTGTGYRMEQVLQEIQRQTDQAVKVRWERPRVEIRQSILWPGNLKQALPWDWAPLSLNAGLARTLAWAQNEYGVLTDDGPVMAAPPTLD